MPRAPAHPSGAALSLMKCTMSEALKRAKTYRYLAKEYRRLATINSSTETRNHYLQMAEHYSTLAEAEELSTLAHVNSY